MKGVCKDTPLFLAIYRWLIPGINFDLYPDSAVCPASYIERIYYV